MSTCNSTILARLQSQDTFNAWKNATSAELNAISANAQNGALQPSPSESSTFSTLSADILSTTSCIQSQLTNLSGTSNQIHSVQEEIMKTKDTISQSEEDSNIARDRVAYIRHPERQTSYYESWFPMDRPMRTSSVPIFVGLTVFIILFSILLILSFLGIDFNIVIHPTLQVLAQYLYTQFTWLTLIQTLLAIYSIYYFTYRK
jgi:hypothetical protein